MNRKEAEKMLDDLTMEIHGKIRLTGIPTKRKGRTCAMEKRYLTSFIRLGCGFDSHLRDQWLLA